MTLREEIEQWLASHPNASIRDAIWAGAEIEIRLWCNRAKT